MSIRSFTIFLLIAGSLFAQNKQISLVIGDLPRFLDESSPNQSLINFQQSLVKVQLDESLQWSNPELSFAQEHVEKNGLQETEQLFLINKTFSMPWNYLKRRSIWQANLEAANLTKERSSKALLAKARTGYIKSELLHKIVVQQNDIKEILKNLKNTIRSQNDEGVISRLEAKLLAISLFGLESDIMRTRKEKRLETNNLKQMLGIDSAYEIFLGTTILFKKVQIKNINNQNIMEEYPGLKAARERLFAAQQKITMEKGQIVPSFTVQGGYKRIDPGWEGYVLGLSIPLPVLNWNNPQIEEQTINHQIQETENNIYHQKLQSQLQNLIEVIRDQIQLLQDNDEGQYNFGLVNDLLVAYQEGTMSLTEFLNAIQIYRNGTRQYTDQLIEYYAAVFELEVLYGKQLVIFQ